MLRSLLPITGLAFAALAALFIGTGCAAAKEARLGVEETLQPRYVERITSEVGGPVEIHCGVSEACVEVKVVHVQRATDGGVEVTLQNRTESAVAVQVSLEGMDARHRRTDRTGFHDVVLAPRGEQVLALSTLAADDDVLILTLRSRAGA